MNDKYRHHHQSHYNSFSISANELNEYENQQQSSSSSTILKEFTQNSATISHGLNSKEQAIPPPPVITPSTVFSQAFVTNLLDTVAFSKQTFFQFFPIYYLSSQKKHNVTPFFKQKKLMSKYIQYLLLKSIEDPVNERCIIFNKQKSCYLWCINAGIKKKNSENDIYMIMKYDVFSKNQYNSSNETTNSNSENDSTSERPQRNFWEFYKFSTWINAVLYEDFYSVQTIPKAIIPFTFENSNVFTNPALFLKETESCIHQKTVHFLLNLHKLLTTSKQIFVRKKLKLYWDNLTQIEISNRIIPKLEKSILQNATENFVPGVFFDFTTSKFLIQLMLPVSLKMNGKIDLVIGFEKISAPLQSFSILNENNNYEYNNPYANNNNNSENLETNEQNLQIAEESNNNNNSSIAEEGHTYWNARSLFTPLEAYIYAKFICPEPTQNWLINLQ